MANDKSKGRIRKITITFIVWVFILATFILILENCIVKKQIYIDNNNQTIETNPLIGYAINADYPEAVDDNTLVYIDLLWSEIENVEGIYDFSKIYEENYIEEHKKSGRKAVLRVICDLPGENPHFDIPMWVYEKTGDGTIYDIGYGKGYSPNYSNEIFIDAHKRLLKAIADEFCKDNFVAYIELGSLGHWGEWHTNVGEGVNPMPTEAVCMEYVKQYVDTFQGVCLLMRRPFLGVKKYSLGVFNDMVGYKEATEEWLAWINQGGEYDEPEDTHTLYKIEEFYNKGVVGGEFTSSLSWEEMLESNLDETKKLILRSHMTFIGPKAPNICEIEEYQKAAKDVRGLLGYKIGIPKAVTSCNILSKNIKINMIWNNKGIAPIYYDWPIYAYVYNQNNEIIEKKKIDLNISQILPGEVVGNKFCITSKVGEVKKIYIGIEDEMFDKPSIKLNNEPSDKENLILIYNK